MRTLTMGTLAVVAVLAPAPTASGDRAPVKPGTCTKSSTSKIKAKLDDGRIETEFEVDQNVNGQRWNVVLRRNGRVVFRGVRTTSGPSGSFELRRLLGNSPAVTGSPPRPAPSTAASSARLLQPSRGPTPYPRDRRQSTGRVAARHD